jgi:hypothetical protein
MAGEFRPLHDVLRELRPLVQQKASGFFFVVTEDNHSCTIRLRNGDIDDVQFSRQRNDEAVQLLSTVTAARARFQPIAVSSSGSRGTLSAASRQWLLGGFENAPPLTLSPSAAPTEASAGNVPSGTGVSDAQQAVIEKIALNYFGPIASLLCEEAFVPDNTMEQALAQIASNLTSPDETRRFMADARAGLARVA